MAMAELFVRLPGQSPSVGYAPKTSAIQEIYRSRAFSAISCLYRYPQLLQNTLLKSVAGISYDFTIYNWLGFICYSTFNLCLYLHPLIRQEYRCGGLDRHSYKALVSDCTHLLEQARPALLVSASLSLSVKKI